MTVSTTTAVALAATVLLAATAAHAAGEATSAGVARRTQCENEHLSAHAATDGTFPVLYVHGWTGSPDYWTSTNYRVIDEDYLPLDQPIADQISHIVGGADPWLLDYHNTSALWVDQPGGGGPHVATAIDCLRDAYGTNVVVVAHSMGGLATRWAVNQDNRHTKVVAVVTFGTPHTGSDIAATAAYALGITDDDNLRTDALINPAITLIRLCGLAATNLHVDACAPLPSFIAAYDSQAGRALRTGSPELAALPDWPDGLPTLSLAGSIALQHQTSTGLFYQSAGAISIGDSVVMPDSATATGTQTYTAECRHNLKLGYALSDDVGQLLGTHYDENNERSITTLLTDGGGPCWHGKLSETFEVVQQAQRFIHEHTIGVGTALSLRDYNEIAAAVNLTQGRSPDAVISCHSLPLRDPNDPYWLRPEAVRECIVTDWTSHDPPRQVWESGPGDRTASACRVFGECTADFRVARNDTDGWDVVAARNITVDSRYDDELATEFIRRAGIGSPWVYDVADDATATRITRHPIWGDIDPDGILALPYGCTLTGDITGECSIELRIDNPEAGSAPLRERFTVMMGDVGGDYDAVTGSYTLGRRLVVFAAPTPDRYLPETLGRFTVEVWATGHTWMLDRLDEVDPAIITLMRRQPLQDPTVTGCGELGNGQYRCNISDPTSNGYVLLSDTDTGWKLSAIAVTGGTCPESGCHP